MLEVVMGKREPGDPNEESVRKLEGWILGQGHQGRNGRAPILDDRSKEIRAAVQMPMRFSDQRTP